MLRRLVCVAWSTTIFYIAIDTVISGPAFESVVVVLLQQSTLCHLFVCLLSSASHAKVAMGVYISGVDPGFSEGGANDGKGEWGVPPPMQSREAFAIIVCD